MSTQYNVNDFARKNDFTLIQKWSETRKLHSYLYGRIISRLFIYIICTQSSLLESDFWNPKALLMLIGFFWACLFSRNCTCCEFREVIYLMATSSTGMYTYVYSIENVIHILLLCGRIEFINEIGNDSVRVALQKSMPRDVFRAILGSYSYGP